jgi:adenylate cyclase
MPHPDSRSRVEASQAERSPEPAAAARPLLAEPDALLRKAELRGERLAAWFRVVIFGALLSVVALTGEGLHRIDIAFWTALYGIGTLVGLLFAWRGVIHPAIPYGFITFDVVLVSIQLLLLTQAAGMPPRHSLAMPVAMLVFVIMVHAAMRYRPWLVVYAAGLFVLITQAGPLFLPAHDSAAVATLTMHHGDPADELLLFQVVPVTIIGLCGLILFVTVHRTRGVLSESVRQTHRATRLERYFSPDIARALAAASDQHLLAGSRQRAAVLFVDLRGFTALAETMDPTALGAFLSQFRSRLSQPVFTHGGTIDKFIGDAIMAVFGAPLERPDDGRRALSCALEMTDVASRWSQERQRAGLTAVGIGIGGHYGEIFAGVLGDERLLEYTVIGDTVNVAERLERLTRQLDSPLVVSSSLLAAAGATAASDKWQPLKLQALPGHAGLVEAFALTHPRLRASSTPAPRETDQATPIAGGQP